MSKSSSEGLIYGAEWSWLGKPDVRGSAARESRARPRRGLWGDRRLEERAGIRSHGAFGWRAVVNGKPGKEGIKCVLGVRETSSRTSRWRLR